MPAKEYFTLNLELLSTKTWAQASNLNKTSNFLSREYKSKDQEETFPGYLIFSEVKSQELGSLLS